MSIPDTWNTITSPDVQDSAPSTSSAESPNEAPDVTAPKKRRARKPRPGDTRAIIKRAIEFAGELELLTEDDRELAALLVGSDADVASLVATVLTQSKADRDAITAIIELVTSDQATRGVSFLTADASLRKQTWKVLAGLNLLPDAMPAADAKAGMAIIGLNVPDSTLDQLRALADIVTQD